MIYPHLQVKYTRDNDPSDRGRDRLVPCCNCKKLLIIKQRHLPLSAILLTVHLHKFNN